LLYLATAENSVNPKKCRYDFPRWHFVFQKPLSILFCIRIVSFRRYTRISFPCVTDWEQSLLANHYTASAVALVAAMMGTQNSFTYHEEEGIISGRISCKKSKTTSKSRTPSPVPSVGDSNPPEAYHHEAYDNAPLQALSSMLNFYPRVLYVS
jgi:hypothetical protein